MSFLESLVSGVSSLFSGISSVLSNSPLMSALLPVLAVVIPPPLDIVAVVAVSLLASVLSGKNEDPERLGWQMNEADKKPEEFNSFKEYRAYLDEKFPVDEKRFNAMNENQRAECRYYGMAGLMTQMRESGLDVSAEALGMFARAKSALQMDDSTLGTFVKDIGVNLKNEGKSSLDPITDAVKGTISSEDYDIMTKSINEAMKNLPKTDLSDAMDVILKLRDSNEQK